MPTGLHSGATSSLPCGFGRLLLVAVLLTAEAVARASDLASGLSQLSALSELGDDKLAVRESGLAGAGLGAFALRNFAPGELLGVYHCDIWPVRAARAGKNSARAGSRRIPPHHPLSLCAGRSSRRGRRLSTLSL